MHVHISCNRGANIDSDGRCVDQLDLRNAFRGDGFHILRQCFAVCHGLQRRNQTFEHHGRLPRAGHAGDGGQPSSRNFDGQRLDRVNRVSRHLNRAEVKQVRLVRPRAHLHGRFTGQECADFRLRVSRNRVDRALCDHIAAVFSGLRSHLDEPVRVLEDFRVVIHQHDRVAVRDQIAHNTAQTLDIGRMQANGRLIEHIQHAGRAVAHRTRQLHALAFSGGQRGRFAVERQIAKAEFHQACRHAAERIADALRHRHHFGRQACGNGVYPVAKFGKRQFACIRQGVCTDFWRTRPLAQPRAAAVRARTLLEKPLDTLHALLILDLGQRVFDRIRCVKVGKIHLTGRTGLGILVDHVDFVRRSVEHNVAFLRGQFAERNVRAHAHFLRDFLHQRPHERLPRQDSDSSGTSVDSSTTRTMPVPSQCGHAPVLLNDSSSADGG